MNFELTGKIIEILDLVQVSERFKKQEFVIERTENTGNFDFTDYIKFQLTQDRTGLIQGKSVGDEVKVSFNIRGNKWEKQGKVNYFTNLDAWRIEMASQGGEVNAQMPPSAPNDPNEMPPEENVNDDLPF